jgi:UDP-N-acetylglucosamine--N-acetylmuramyl-(pentapeptide) pyrophosphoryl-undecaprenol N-acetylglucosamine transferase
LSQLKHQFSIVHVCGKGNVDDSLQGIAGYWQLEYLHEDMVDALWLADLVIGRAGATTLAELEALQKAAVLIPLPASVSRGDQLVNAEAYAHRRSGMCIVVPDDEDLKGGAPLVDACIRLINSLPDSGSTSLDPADIHRVASVIARQTINLAKPGQHRPQ